MSGQSGSLCLRSPQLRLVLIVFCTLLGILVFSALCLALFLFQTRLTQKRLVDIENGSKPDITSSQESKVCFHLFVYVIQTKFFLHLGLFGDFHSSCYFLEWSRNCFQGSGRCRDSFYRSGAAVAIEHLHSYRRDQRMLIIHIITRC